MLYTYLRTRFLLSRRVASRISARTVLFTNVPTDQRSEEALRAAFGQVRHVWLAADAKELEDLAKDSDKTSMKLEGAEVKFCKTATKAYSKDQAQSQTSKDVEDPMRWADTKKRPTHRLKYVGKKVDSIDWCREHLSTILPEIESQQALYYRGAVQTISAAFIEFETVGAAEAAFRNAGYQRREKMVARAVGVRPAEVVWDNLGMSQAQRKARHLIADLLIVGLLFIWAPLTVFIGALSNIQYLTNKVPFLSFILKVPSPILGIITGLIPVVLLAVLMMLVPILMRSKSCFKQALLENTDMFAELSKMAGAATLSEIELDTQAWYFCFQIVIVFLLTTVSSGASAVASQIVSNPSAAATLLAQNLPKASNFYINYLVLNGVASSAKTLSNAVGLLIYLLVGKYLDSTPRKVYQRYTKLSPVQWGSVYPPVTMLVGIGKCSIPFILIISNSAPAFAYSCIAPLILGFATIAFYLLYIANRYNLLYALDAAAINEQGAGFELSLHHLFAGIYIAEVCLIGLFAISTANNKVATGALVIMILFTIATIIFQVLLARTTNALRKSLAQELHASTRGQTQVSRDLNPDQEQEQTQEDPYNTNEPLSPFGDHARVIDTDDDKWETSSTNPDDIALRNNPSPTDQHSRSNYNTTTHAATSAIPTPHGFLARLLSPKSIPSLDACLDIPVRGYTPEQRRLAYMHPAVSARKPLLWIPADNTGLAEREAREMKKIGVDVSTKGAWWSADGKARLETVLDTRQSQHSVAVGRADWSDDGVKEAPIWEREREVEY